jgi:dienelactone hydrolase
MQESEYSRNKYFSTVLACLLCCLVSTAATAMTHTEILSFTTVAMSDQQLLRGKGGEETGIAGVLRLPSENNNPVVILLYGSGGYGDYLDDWVSLLNNNGIGTFMVDSTSGRIQGGMDGEQNHLRQLSVIRDAYAALELLSKHPAVDPARIGLLGFSRAGQGALYAGMARMQQLYGKNVGHGFAGIVSFYPNCSFHYRNDEQLIGSPVEIFHGEADDVNAFAPCQDFTRRASAAGADIRLVGYPGVLHGFDWSAKTPSMQEQNGSTSACDIREEVKGLLINKATGRLFRFEDDCVKPAGKARFDAGAFADVKRQVPAFFEKVFGQS